MPERRSDLRRNLEDSEMRRLLTGSAAVVLAGAVVVAAAQAPPALGPIQWQIDPNHSAANFSVRHLMVTTVRGVLGPITGTIEYDGKDVRTVTADVTIDV